MLYHKYYDINPNSGLPTNNFIEDFLGIYSSINIIFDKILKIKSKSKSNIFYFYIGTCEIDKEFDIQYSNDYAYKERRDYYKSNEAIFDDNEDLLGNNNNFIFGNYTEEEENIHYKLLDINEKIREIRKETLNNKHSIINQDVKFRQLLTKYNISQFYDYYYIYCDNLKNIRKNNLYDNKKILDCYTEFLEYLHEI